MLSISLSPGVAAVGVIVVAVAVVVDCSLGFVALLPGLQ
jgi:hypothetical protein